MVVNETSSVKIIRQNKMILMQAFANLLKNSFIVHKTIKGVKC